jgi:hypothetical protein
VYEKRSATAQKSDQQFIQNLLVVLFSFALSLLLAKLFMPWFNHMASKEMFIPWANPWFWIFSLGFALITTRSPEAILHFICLP